MVQFAEFQEIESLISRSELVQFCLAAGVNQSFYSVLITPNKQTLREVLREHDSRSEHDLNTYRGLNHIEVRSVYCDLLEQVNKQWSGKRIERFVLVELDAHKSRNTLYAENEIIIESFYQEFIPGIG